MHDSHQESQLIENNYLVDCVRATARILDIRMGPPSNRMSLRGRRRVRSVSRKTVLCTRLSIRVAHAPVAAGYSGRLLPRAGSPRLRARLIELPMRSASFFGINAWHWRTDSRMVRVVEWSPCKKSPIQYVRLRPARLIAAR